MFTRVTGRSRTLLLIGASTLVGALAAFGILAAAGWLVVPATSRQTMVHEMGSRVMPFDLAKTRHIFNMNETGGIQQVIAKDPHDARQIALIRQHLQHEAMQFRVGDFTDPTSLHGRQMPGLEVLTASASQIKIDFSPLPDGAQITFWASDIRLITALHRWFGAQLSDHGADAASQ